MDLSDYYSIDAILAENQKVQCKFKQKIPDMGHLGGSTDRDIVQNAKLQVPVWLAYIVLYSDWADLVMPTPFIPRVHNALKAEPRSVRLSTLTGAGGSWYMFGKMIMDIVQGNKAEELASLMTEAFKIRLAETVDQAQHFASLGPIGAGGPAGDPAQAFREGLDITEREIFILTQESVKRTKWWFDEKSHR
ncbi:hypothetical protein AMATHDRAFT_80766 [Amanita thiersii Skay4041]|uniref:DNA replication complex GINS protein PSF3 n=1 Tax=Amanita thiersii Skay4041 TaxID=703135 RepID=A0A2A9NSA1_9AGAR|nr:hypothetical protein AMATHDRAFT_80766 [Amanita thiersii Skay4041]